LCLDPVLKQAARDQPDFTVGPITLPPILAYQDDVHLLANSEKALQAMITRFCQGAQSIGMKVRSDKCWVFTTAKMAQGRFFRTSANEGQSSVLRYIQWNSKDIEILGVPFGAEPLIKSALSKAASNIASDMEKLCAIPAGLVPEEVKAYLSLLCVPPRMSYLLRHSPSEDISAAEEADTAMQDGLCKILALNPTPNLRGVLTVPQRDGGWGLMVLEEVAKIAPRAALLSMALTIDSQYPLHSALVSLLQLDPKDPGSSNFIKSACTPTALLPLEFNNPQTLVTALGPNRKLQSFVYAQSMRVRTAQLVQNLPETAYLRRFPSRDYTFAVPPKPYYPLGPALATRLQYIAGVSPAGILRRSHGAKCPNDNSIMTAAHVFVCKATASVCKTNMHDCIRSALVRSLRSVKGAMVLEEHQMPNINGTRLDALVELGQRWGLDFTACEVASNLDQRPEAILNERYRAKLRKYQGYGTRFSKMGESPLQIVPLVFTSFGSPSATALDFLKKFKVASRGEFRIKPLLNKIALISAHYNHQALCSWRAGVTRRLSPQSFERQSGSKWQSAFKRHSHQ